RYCADRGHAGCDQHANGHIVIPCGDDELCEVGTLTQGNDRCQAVLGKGTTPRALLDRFPAPLHALGALALCCLTDRYGKRLVGIDALCAQSPPAIHHVPAQLWLMPRLRPDELLDVRLRNTGGRKEDV